MRIGQWIGPGVMFAVVAAVAGGCGEVLTNQAASLGSNVAGGRGTFRVLFINNTEHSAAFTYGAYDQTDPAFAPDFAQFGPTQFDVGLVALGPGESSSIDPTNSRSFLSCARVFSVGSERLLQLVRENRTDAEPVAEALIGGVEFFDLPDASDEPANEEPVSRGSAPPFEALLGVDFPCNALLIVRLEIDDVGPDPFRVDFEMVPAESDR